MPSHAKVRQTTRITGIVIEIAFLNLVRWWLHGDQASGLTYLALALPLAITWAGCLSELFARAFQSLFDPKDERPGDLKEHQRALDTIARLVREERREEAIRLCRERIEAGDTSILAMEALLEQLEGRSRGGGSVPPPEASPAATDALRAAPGALAATVDMRKQSIDELLAEGYRGTAIEMLEEKLQERPRDFDLRLKLAEVHARHCENLKRAQKIIDQIESDGAFTAEQKQQARTKLKEWRAARG